MKLGLKARLVITYGIDWLVGITLAGFINFYLDRFQFYNNFDLTDASIQYPFSANERISNKLLGVFIVGAYVIIAGGNLIFSRSWWDFHQSILGVNIAYALTGAVTQIVRIAVGRPRPDFIARCLPRLGSENAPVFGLVNITVCTTGPDNSIIKDGMRSFFSGHASLTAAGLGFASLYLAGKVHLFDRKQYTTKVWLVFTPVTGSVLVSITRIMDHRHHWQDVTIGMLVGFFFAYFMYRQFYPSLDDPDCHLPYPPRISNVPMREPQQTRSGTRWQRLSNQDGENMMLVEPWKPTPDLEAGLQSTSHSRS